MNKLVAGLATTAVICAVAYAPIGAAAETDADKAALQKATAECRARVKEYAQYHETSWYQRHKMVKTCVNQALAKK
jgi:hypothetical protein